MCSESDYFRSKIESCPAAAKCVATAFYYSFLIPANQFQKSKIKSNER